jgi:hypothetical protein
MFRTRHTWVTSLWCATFREAIEFHDYGLPRTGVTRHVITDNSGARLFLPIECLLHEEQGHEAGYLPSIVT